MAVDDSLSGSRWPCGTSNRPVAVGLSCSVSARGFHVLPHDCPRLALFSQRRDPFNHPRRLTFMVMSRKGLSEPALGTLLPCNVVVRRGEDARETTIEAIDTQTMVRLSDTPAVREIAEDAGARLRKALTGLADADESSA
jgi:hypothetical protein